MNALQRLYPEFGQSIWFDFISRQLLDTGTLAKLAQSGEVRGVTSNPSIFEKAIGEGVEYAPALEKLRKAKPKATAFELYENLAVTDIQNACDVMRSVYDSSKSRDGYVSLEVTMQKGETAADILEEARHLWVAVGRPNVMIKVPGTKAGIAAFEDLIAEGVNVNVTLLFAVDTYVDVAKAYVAGLEKRDKKNGKLDRIASVASFFVSRIDSVVDKALEAQISSALNEKDRSALKGLLGKVAIANAKIAYAEYGKVFSGKKWEALAKKGAQTQRVLWASTGTKNKAYSDVLYIEELIGQDTVNTAPPQTIDAFRDHGKPRASLAQGLADAKKVMKEIEGRQISMKAVTDQLLADGLKQFSDAFDKLLATVAGSAKSSATQASAGHSTPYSFVAPKEVTNAVSAALTAWAKANGTERLWSRDAKLWTNGDEAQWLGWLDAPKTAKAAVAELNAFGAEVKKGGFTHVLLLGMGGSSLCPDVLRHTFGSTPPTPMLEVLDSTDPAQVAAIERKVDLAKTLVIVASKSGSTLEPSIMEQYFFDRMSKLVGKDAGKHFVAITDPGSKLEAVAKAKNYRRIFAGVPSIGGRFSALSNFGLVPAAAIGVDLAQFTARASLMADACGPKSKAESNPGVQLGALLGASAKLGRDKLTFIVSPQIASLGGWLEQLVAESTGKIGKGIVPVDLEPVGPPSVYGNDRVFVYVRLEAAPDKAQDAGIEALEKAGHVVARIRVGDKLDLGAEFFRWEIATAVAGSILELHPFDQPDVEASKIVTKELTSAYEKSGALPAEKAFFEEGKLRLFADAKYAQRLFKATGAKADLVDVLRAHLDTLKAGDYFALLAYIDMNAKHTTDLSALRNRVRDVKHVATVLEFGPRFLHSTGQAYKGGPNSGVFLQITCDDRVDVPVPGAKYTFGVVKAAQARGDFQVLVERGRRALRIHVTGDLAAGLSNFGTALVDALSKPAHSKL
ncbi:MAG: bifunctional transaldolase/phosoglucose isomerase [Planctomycetes bacterium]|nr:bifunctional transaldolase/phosoglucose isomerase [Planctomycetota bacterium]